MKKNLIIAIMALVGSGIFFAFKTTEKSEWVLDKAHSKLGFTVNHLMVSEVEGRFKDFDAKIISEKEDFSDAVVTMTAQVTSLNTDNDVRDKDLKSDKYLDAAKYPIITFRSKTFTKVDNQNFKVTGDMTIHGFTKTVELNAFYRTGINPMNQKTVSGFKVTGTINRLDFAVGSSTPSAIIGEEVTLVANVEFWKNSSL